MFAKRIANLRISPTVAIDVKAKEFRRLGIPVINVSVGEPDFQTPENIKKAAIKAIHEGHTFYTAPDGIIELREAIVKKLKKDNNIVYDPADIIVGVGVKEILYTIFQVLCDTGDEVVIALPAYNTFVEQVKLANATPVTIMLKPPFKLTANDVKIALTPQTKILILNTPANPTGAMIDPLELKKIADLAVKNNFLIVTDEIYEKFVYAQEHISIASLNEEVKKHTITVGGLSKTYAMTGWRVGYAAGPTEIIAKMKVLQSQLVVNTSSISQYAAVEALNGSQISVEEMKKVFAKRRSFCSKALSQIKELSFIEPEGAFYFFVSIEKLLGKKYPTATEWVEALLEKEKVAVVPGEAFFYPGYIRISYAASDEDLKEALRRIKRFIDKS